MTFIRRLKLFAFTACAALSLARGAPISNQAAGTSNGVPLDVVRARVDLVRVTGTVTSALAEISPNRVTSATPANAFTYDILPTIGPGDAGVSRIDLTAPAGYANLAVTGLSVAGTAWTANCPTPGPNQYCASVSGSVMTVTLGSKIKTNLADIRIAFTADAPAPIGSADFTSTVSDGPFTLATNPGNADGDAADANSITVEVVATQGLVLNLAKAANKSEAIIGEVVTYFVEIRNTVNRDIHDVLIADQIPPDFRYVEGSARLDGAPIPSPTGNRPLVFTVGTVPALDDQNGNGHADPGEPGYRILVYQLVVGSGAVPGAYTNTAAAIDYCDTCLLAPKVSATVQVRLDPTFDLGTILGKVFADPNGDGVQQEDEPGIAGAFVALDDGTYALTDAFGRYHFPAVRPGHRMVKVDLKRLAPGACATNGESQVVWVTPGLMLTVNFGVRVLREIEQIGTPDVPGVAVRAEPPLAPVDVRGNAESLSLAVDGTEVPLPAGDVRLATEELDGTVRLAGSRLEEPVRFHLEAGGPAPARSWTLAVLDSEERTVKTFRGEGAPPAELTWDGLGDDLRIVAAGEIYSYQLDVEYADGSATSSPRRLLGVNRSTITAIQLTGEAFESGKAILSPRAKEILDAAAKTLEGHPDEKVLIEGHTDWVGSNAYNLNLSKARAESARRYLVEAHGLPSSRFVLAWYGEDRPVAPNDTPEGRALNRRVVIQGQVKDVDPVRILDGYHTAPQVRIGDTSIEVGERGRFSAPVPTDPASPLTVTMNDPSGRTVRAVVPLPTVRLTSPTGERLLAYGEIGGGCVAGQPAGGAWGPADTAVTCTLRGATDPGNRVDMDGRPLEVDARGEFASALPLHLGANTTGIVVRDAAGVTRVANLTVHVADRDGDGRLLVTSSGIPELALELPPRDAMLSDPKLEVRGHVAPGGQVTVNGQPAEVAPDGSFIAVVTLPRGTSKLVATVTDARGRKGSIEREFTVSKNQLFLMAFAEGTVGQLKTKGYLEGAGSGQASDYYTDGRVAYYLKGVVSGKYLITSAYDSAKNGNDSIFGNIDASGAARLLTNLDPDRYYPVYGDESTVVWDAQSRGKFYLAVDSDTIHAVVGDFPLSLNETELSAYRRTLYGGRFVYRSASTTRFGDPDTEVVVFGAEVKHAHLQDEIAGTGGSLYYLSRRDVVEGSEEITIVVRDKNTGLMISSERQRRNLDYVIKYPEGRVMFQRPIASVVPGGSIVDQATLQGNPVSILVDYEVVLDSFEKTAAGGRVRQQLGDRVAVGATYVSDELASGSYELKGADAEVRIGEGSRVFLEGADTSGNDSTIHYSQDGGLTYTEVAATPGAGGSAWKAAADLDVGEWFGAPNKYRVRAFRKQIDPGFFSSGNFQEQGSTKTGFEAVLDVTGSDSIRLRYDRDDLTGGTSLVTSASETTTLAAQWSHAAKRWGIITELFDTSNQSATATVDRTYGAAHFWAKVTDKLTARFEQQSTLSGTDNNRTSLGVQYQALPHLALEALASDGTDGMSAQAGAVYTVGETNVYLSERLSDTAAGEATTTVLGARAPIGRSSKVYTEYQWEDSDSGGRTVQLVGMQKQWDPEPGLRFLLSAENAEASGQSGTTDRTAVSAGVSWMTAEGLRLVSRQEMRWESGTARTRQYFTVNQFDYKIHPDLTAIARLRYSLTENRDSGATDAKLDERVVGLAYRPVRSDRFNALFKYTSLLDQRPVQASGQLRTSRRMDVFSLDTSFRFTPRIEWLAKEAARIMDETVEDLPSTHTNTWLVVQRLNVRIWKSMSLAAEYRILNQQQADDQREGWLSEAMWEFMKNFSVGVGYNFTDFSDNVFSANDYRVDGWFFRVQARY